jgi:hypothetical protein
MVDAVLVLVVLSNQRLYVVHYVHVIVYIYTFLYLVFVACLPHGQQTYLKLITCVQDLPFFHKQ